MCKGAGQGRAFLLVATVLQVGHHEGRGSDWGLCGRGEGAGGGGAGLLEEVAERGWLFAHQRPRTHLAPKKLDSLSVKQLATCMWALAAMQVPPPPSTFSRGGAHAADGRLYVS